MPRRRSPIAVVLLLALLAQLALAAAPARAQETGPGAGERAALAELNLARQAAGLDPVLLAPGLSSAAVGHAAYIRLNLAASELDAHREEPGRPGFTGVTPLDRARRAGWPGDDATEVVAYEPSALAAVRGWLASPYHRLPLLAANAVAAGFGGDRAADMQIQTMTLGTSRGVRLAEPLVYPAPGQAGVPTGWHGRESPDPLRSFSGASGPLGYTVSVTFPGRVTFLHLDEARLTGPAGDVPLYVLNPTDDDQLVDTLALLPKAPLAGNARYTARVRGRVDYGGGPRTVDLQWQFTTAAPAPDARRAVWWTQNGRAYEFSLEGTGLDPGTRIFLGGLPVIDVRAEGARARFRPPAGLPPGPADLLAVTAGGEVRWPEFLTGRLALQPSGRAPETWPVVQETDAGTRRIEAKAIYQAGQPDPLLLSAAGLRALGGSVTAEDATGLYLFRLGSRWAVAGPGTAAAWSGVDSAPHLGRRTQLARPPLLMGGEVYIPITLVQLLGAAAGVDAVNRTAVVGAGVRFPDTLGHWARTAILDLAGRGIVSGFEDGTYRPEVTLSRAALTKVMAGAAGLPPVPGLDGLFADTRGHWVSVQGWLGAAAGGGLLVIAEYPGGAFLPNQDATRLEVAVMSVRALGLEAEAQRRAGQALGALYIDGASVPAAYRGHFALALERGILTGYPEPGGRFSLRPSRTATRAEAAAIVARMLAQLGR